MAKEAVGFDPLPSEGALLAVPTADGRAPCPETHEARQGAPARLQGQTGIRHIPCPREAGRAQEEGSQGAQVRQADQPGRHAAQVPEEPTLRGRGEKMNGVR